MNKHWIFGAFLVTTILLFIGSILLTGIVFIVTGVILGVIAIKMES